MATSGGTDGRGQVPTGPTKPPSYLVSSVIVTLVCCAPFGVIAIIYGLLAQTRWSSGDAKGSMHASDMAEKWMYGGIGAAVLGVIGGVIWWFFVGRHNTNARRY